MLCTTQYHMVLFFLATTSDWLVQCLSVQMCSPAQLRQQSAELYATIDELLEDPIQRVSCHQYTISSEQIYIILHFFTNVLVLITVLTINHSTWAKPLRSLQQQRHQGYVITNTGVYHSFIVIIYKSIIYNQDKYNIVCLEINIDCMFTLSNQCYLGLFTKRKNLCSKEDI